MKRHLYKTNKILVAGGWGYSNLGDEAQCHETLKLLTKRYPDFQIINLSPNPEHSHNLHNDFHHDFASRVLFFNQYRYNNCFNFKNNKPNLRFLFKALHIYLNAILIKLGLPTLFLTQDNLKMLWELQHASLLYFGGGGYLTGSTLSRMLDGALLCRICHLFETPVVMSGQTIGIWGNKFNQFIAKWGFKHVDVITVRDEQYSLADLKKINLEGDNYFATHDDALFCEKSTEKQVNSKNYITMNFHYWGMSENDKKVYINKIKNIVDHIFNTTNFDIIFIPMDKADLLSYNDFINKYPSNRFTHFDYSFNFRKVRRVIADSKLCITMKHHPIIFAMGESVPAISLAFSNYYVHKNVGALLQYEQEKYSINLEDENCFEQFTELFNDILNNSDKIKKVINTRKNILIKRKENFLRKVDKILSRKYVLDKPLIQKIKETMILFLIR